MIRGDVFYIASRFFFKILLKDAKLERAFITKQIYSSKRELGAVMFDILLFLKLHVNP